MAIPEFKVPSFLEDQDAETIHRRMMEALPADIDDTEAGFPWDFTKPAALEKAELLEFHIPETIKMMFPMWSHGEWLDIHARSVGTERKPANAASGKVVVTGAPGTSIPAGFRFATPAIGSIPAVEYEAIDSYVVGEGGTVEVQIVAVEPGIKGNVSPGSVTLMLTPIKGITSITNPDQITGGAEEESDDELRRRIDEIDAASEASHVGNDGDYKRWTEEVPGVGTGLVVPEWDGPGTVKVIVIDSNGQPANETIIEAVYDHIMREGDRLQRKAPIGAIVTVVAPTAKQIDYVFVLELQPGETAATVVARFREQLQLYYVEAKRAGEVQYTWVASILRNTPGVSDYSDFTMNGGTSNIIIDGDEYPVTGTVDPTGGGG